MAFLYGGADIGRNRGNDFYGGKVDRPDMCLMFHVFLHADPHPSLLPKFRVEHTAV